MKLLTRLATVLALSLILAPPVLAQVEVTFPTMNEDGATVYADRYAHAGTQSRGTALLFHDQASGAVEYREIAPRLAALGFEVLAVDLRTGSNNVKINNRTYFRTRAYINTYDDGVPDVQGALAYARKELPDDPLILFGSGVAGDMVILVAANDPAGIAAVLAFSPPSLLVYSDEAEAASRLTVPLFVTYGTTPSDELTTVAKVTDAVPPAMLTLHKPVTGVHGAPTLTAAANPDGWESNWAAVEAFLDRVAPKVP